MLLQQPNAIVKSAYFSLTCRRKLGPRLRKGGLMFGFFLFGVLAGLFQLFLNFFLFAHASANSLFFFLFSVLLLIKFVA